MTINELAIAAKTDSNYIEPLWLSVYKLIKIWADRYNHEQNPRYDTDDLIQAAYFAFIKAIEQYPCDSQYKFTTYLRYHCRNEFRAVAGIRTRKREPLVYPLDKKLTEDGLTLADTLEDKEAAERFADTEDSIYNSQLHNALDRAMNTLPPKHKQVLVTRFYENKLLREIAEEQKCAYQFVSDIEKQAIRRLRHGKAIRILKEFDYYRYSVRRSGYRAFRENMQSSVEGAVLKKLELEEWLINEVLSKRYNHGQKKPG